MKKQLLFVALSLVSTILFAQKEGTPGGGNPGGERPTGSRPGRTEGNRGRGNSEQADRPAIGKVRGMVADSLTGEPVPFATVALKSLSDSTYLTGGVTDEKGRFQISEIRLGAYSVAVDFIGFEKKEMRLRLNPRSGTDLDLGKINLLPSGVELKTAEVVADKPLIINAIDRKIFNAEKLMTATGGSATDLLRQVPLVQVDVDGNLSMRGSDNLTVLIDGRPSGLTGAGRKALLENLPASSVESVEVITNPSAKFDPDGTSGIVNIVLKKNKLTGTSGAFQAGLGSHNKGNFGGQIARRKGRWNTYGSYNFRYEENYNRGESYRVNYDSTGKRRSIFDQPGRGENRPLNHFGKAGADHYFGSKTVLGASAAIGRNIRNEDELVATKIFDPFGKLKVHNERDNDQSSRGLNLDLNLNFKHEFGNRSSLVFDANRSRNTTLTERNFTNQSFSPISGKPVGDPFLQKITTDNRFQLATAQADFTQNFDGKKVKFETGLKTSRREVDTDFEALDRDEATGQFIDDPTRSNRFLFDEKIHAAYANLNRRWGRFGAQAGLRGEIARTSSRLVDTEENIPNDYESLFPSLFLTYDLAPQRTFALNYSKRINRPETQQLNPFADYSDTLNLFRGNPFLKPEYIHSFEVSAQFFAGKFNVVPMLYYRRTVNGISRFQRRIPGTELIEGTQVNIGQQDAWGFDLVANGSLASWWSVSGSINGSYSQFNASNLGTTITNSALFRLNSRATSNWSLPKSWDIQLTGNFQPRSKTLLGNHSAQYHTDIAVTKKFWGDKGSLGLRVADVFDTRRFKMAVEAEGFDRRFVRKRESRIAFLNFSYKFGKLTEQKGRGGQGRRGGPEGNGSGGGGEEF